MTNWNWNGGTADWFTGADWIAGTVTTATFPQTGDTATIATGLALITAADVASHGTLNQITLELDAGFSAIGETFGAATVIDSSLAAAHATLTLGGTTAFAGTIAATGSAGLFLIDAAHLTNTGTILAAGADDITIAATAPLINNATLAAEAGTIVVSGTLTGDGVVDIGQHGTASLANVTGEQTIVFTDKTGTLIVEGTAFDGLVSGFQSGDAIDVTGITATALGYDANTGVLSLRDGATVVDTIEIGGLHSAADFHLTGDGSGGVLVTGPEQRDWNGGDGDWFTTGSWTTPLAPYVDSFPLAGDIVAVSAGTATISAADVAAHGVINQEVIELGSAVSTAPATVAAVGATFGAGVTLVAQDGKYAALALTGATTLAGSLYAGVSKGQFGVADSGVLTNAGIVEVYDTETMTISAATLVNLGQLDIGDGTIILTQGIVLGTGEIELGNNQSQAGYGSGSAMLTIASGVSVAATQQLDFVNGDANELSLSLAHADDFAAAIDGFVRGDTIALAGLVASTDTYTVATGMLALYAAGATAPGAVLDIGLGFQTADFTLTTSSGATLLSTARATGDGADEALHGNQARSEYGVDGTGITVGIISDSFNANGGEAADVASGDLPANVNVLKDARSGTDEGRAMAELVHRIAPGATIDFYEASGTQAGFATAVTKLAAAGAQIIVDDVGYSNEPFFEAGDPAAAALGSVIAGGVDYFSAIGNDGSLFYQGTYSELGSALPGLTGTMKATDFGGGNPLQALTVDHGAELDLQLQWDQPFSTIGSSSGSQNSLSMYLFNSSNVIVASATKSALDGNPIQTLTYTNAGSTAVFRLAIVWDQGTVAPGTYKYIDMTDGADGATIDDSNAEQGSGTATGHDETAGANIVGAVDYVETPAFGSTPPVLEDYSDAGPGLILYGSNGQKLATPLTPAVPDFVSVDGASTGVFDPFYGTSAAAPDAAAVAALMLEANPGLTNTQVTAFLEQSAISLGLPGSYQGAGLIQADRAVALAEAACYLVGTHIATEDGERPIEDLQIGDRLRTASGELRPIRWIGRRRYDGRFAARNPELQPIRVRASAIADGVPARDLFVSPLHALFLDGVLVPAARLVNGTGIDRFAGLTTIDYLHIELDTHDVILAEGLAAETFVDCDSRLMFANAGEFFALYPDDAGETWAFCAERITDGPVLAAIQARLAARAGARVAASGPLIGYFDAASRDQVSGWAFHPEAPHVPVQLELLDEHGVIATMLANGSRADVHDAGLGPVHCGFALRLPTPLPPFARHTLRVRRAGDHTELRHSPRVIEPDYRLSEAAREGLSHAIASAALASRGPGEIDDLLEFLMSQSDAALQVRTRLGFAGASRPTGAARPLALFPAGASRQLALFIDERLPRPDRDAGSHVAISHMRALRALGYDVLCVPADMAPGDRETARLRRLGIGVCARPLYRSVEEVLRRHGTAAAVVYLHRIATAGPYGEMARQFCPAARLVYAVADLHHLRLARQSLVEGQAALMAASRDLRRRELAAVATADVVITHSTVEAAILRRDVPGARVQVVPWTVRPRAVIGPARSRRGIAFIGGHDHAPNRDAVGWLVDEIMPLVWQTTPSMRCLVVGAGWPASFGQDDPRIRLAGPVSRLSRAFAQVRLTVAPLRFGAGVKGKVLESFAAGVPCVMSSMAAEGIALPPALQPWVADDAAGIAARICALHADGAARQVASDSGQAMIAAEYGSEGVISALQAALAGRKKGQGSALDPLRAASLRTIT